MIVLFSQGALRIAPTFVFHFSMRFLEYIQDNRQWIFSGIGVAILGLIWALVRALFRRRRISDTRGPACVQTTPSNPVEAPPSTVPRLTPSDVRPFEGQISAVTFAEISAALKSTPPNRLAEVAKRYWGKWVQWDTCTSSSEMDLILWRMSRFSADDKGVISFPLPNGGEVHCEVVNRSNYPSLDKLPYGVPVTVIGRINRVTQKQVDLEQTQLFFHDET
jgi:hypothetical protein